MFFGCFSSRRNEKKIIIMCVKEKGKNGAEMGLATAQLCHNTMGNYIMTQLVLGVLFGLGEGHNTMGNCIVTQHPWA